MIQPPETTGGPGPGKRPGWLALPDDWNGKPAKVIGLSAALVVLTLMLLLPVPDGLTLPGFRVLMLLALAMCLWLPEVFHPTVSALLLSALLPFTGALTFEESVAGLGNKIIWLLLSVNILTAALGKTGLDRRFAYFIVKRSGGSAPGMLLSIIITGFLIAFIVPNAESRTGILVALSVGILHALNLKPGESNIGRALLIATSTTSLISSPALITGASATMYAAGYFESVLGHHWTYLNWLAVMLPGVVIACVAIWLILLWLFPPEQQSVAAGVAFVKSELDKMGPLTPPEKKLLGLWLVLFGLLLFGQSVVPREMAFLMVSLALFMPGFAILDWPGAAKGVQWGILIFFATSLTLSKAVINSGAADWLASRLVQVVQGLPGWLVTVGIMLLFVLLRFVFTNMTSVLTTLLPVVTSLALSTGKNPIWLGMVAVVASPLCIFAPMQSASNLTSYGAGYYSVGDLAKSGTFVASTVIVITLIMAYLYWPLIGLPVSTGP